MPMKVFAYVKKSKRERNIFHKSISAATAADSNRKFSTRTKWLLNSIEKVYNLAKWHHIANQFFFIFILFKNKLFFFEIYLNISYIFKNLKA